jgi:dinuclear metal center YbgI/SA1388 family protein
MKIIELYNKLVKEMPISLAMSWDNVGLLIGNGSQELKKVLITLDVTESALEKAIKEKCNLIISHHPVIFGKINRINNPMFLKLIRNGIDVISMHTNLDVVPQGVNAILAERLGLENVKYLSKESGNKVYWGKIFVPKWECEDVMKAISQAGGGVYEKYSDCMIETPVIGTFKANKDATPFKGKIDVLEQVDEIELQFRVDSVHKQAVIQAIKEIHPYESPVFHFYEIEDDETNYGLGMIGNLPTELSLEDFANLVKENLNAPFVKLWTADKADKMIKTVSLCGGSGSSLLGIATAKSDVMVTGDVTYHTMLDSSLPIIDAGHFFTEQPIVEHLSNMMEEWDIAHVILSDNEHEIKNLQVIV